MLNPVMKNYTHYHKMMHLKDNCYIYDGVQ